MLDKGKFLETILATKQVEVSNMTEESPGKVRTSYKIYDFLRSQAQQLQIIAEIKKASPSLGTINLDLDPVGQARIYEASGAAMISVLTDSHYFKGDIDHLRQVSESVHIPTLNKDFIIDQKQIDRAVNAGATVVLLIVAALSLKKLEDLYAYASGLGLEVLVEVHNRQELEIAHRLDATLIGINNRNLKTFEVSIETSLALVPDLRPDNIYISESGIFGKSEAIQLAEKFNAILVGTALMQSGNVSKTLKELKVTR